MPSLEFSELWVQAQESGVILSLREGPLDFQTLRHSFAVSSIPPAGLRLQGQTGRRLGSTAG